MGNSPSSTSAVLSETDNNVRASSTQALRTSPQPQHHSQSQPGGLSRPRSNLTALLDQQQALSNRGLSPSAKQIPLSRRAIHDEADSASGPPPTTPPALLTTHSAPSVYLPQRVFRQCSAGKLTTTPSAIPIHPLDVGKCSLRGDQFIQRQVSTSSSDNKVRRYV
jgi:hypothetical protein